MSYIGFLFFVIGGLVLDSRPVTAALLVAAGCILLVGQARKERRGRSEEPAYIIMQAKAYCYGSMRFDSGSSIRTGICAAKPEWFGKIATVYLNDGGQPGRLIGYFECMDVGSEDFQSGKQINLYDPSEPWCRQFGRRQVLVLLIDGVNCDVAKKESPDTRTLYRY